MPFAQRHQRLGGLQQTPLHAADAGAEKNLVVKCEEDIHGLGAATSGRPHQSETDVVQAVFGAPVVAFAGARIQSFAAPTAAAHHPAGTALRADRVVAWTVEIVVRGEAIPGPLPDIAQGIVKAPIVGSEAARRRAHQIAVITGVIGAGTAFERSGGGRVADVGVAAHQLFGLAPVAHTLAASARGVLPLRLGRQVEAPRMQGVEPLGVVHRVQPGEHHRRVLIAVQGEAFGAAAVMLGAPQAKLRVAHLQGGDPERVQTHLVGGAFVIGFAQIIAHGEAAGGGFDEGEAGGGLGPAVGRVLPRQHPLFSGLLLDLLCWRRLAGEQIDLWVAQSASGQQDEPGDGGDEAKRRAARGVGGCPRQSALTHGLSRSSRGEDGAAPKQTRNSLY
ncbi:hypothetical protein MAIT1_03969 [Magnetofaba australis IT-1]|uniref:Uncharacterized protein n=1 Tax=Magnetofaba australis IT-1 TaxID=1434232 RepID=A0A1Y2K925_9PROT|nr:hypothetical protein MAIT1_03969 [Magnetofaba australis IT-1]